MKKIKDQNFPSERALYGADGLLLENCTFAGEEDGESALKEASHVELEHCFMDLRYPLWHNRAVNLRGCEMTVNCRAALWYTEDVGITDSTLGGIKALRECRKVRMKNTKVTSPEFGWRSRDIRAENCELEGEYPFLMAGELVFDRIALHGKYSFQYVENAVIEHAVLDTKDAFWHSKNVTVRDSVIRGEYLAWYAEGLTLERCRIIGTQPLCYCTGLTLIDCEMQDTDLAFEYSDVTATVKGEILSVKNPRSGSITADAVGEILLTDDSKYECRCTIIERNKAK